MAHFNDGSIKVTQLIQGHYNTILGIADSEKDRCLCFQNADEATKVAYFITKTQLNTSRLGLRGDRAMKHH